MHTNLIDTGLTKQRSNSMSKMDKNQGGQYYGVKMWHSNGWNAGDFLKKSTHPTQSNVKVHSTSTLTGPCDQKLNKKAPPLLHFEFWWHKRRRRGGRKSGQKKSTTWELDCVFQQHSLTKGGGRGHVPCPPHGKLHMHAWWKGASATRHTGIHR